MAKILTGSEISEILQECDANGQLSKYITKTEQFFEMPPILGWGYWRNITLRPGLRLNISDLEKRHTHRCQIRQHPNPMPLTFCYVLVGTSKVDNDGLGINNVQEEVAGRSYVYSLPDTSEIEEYLAGKHTVVYIQVFPEVIATLSDRTHELPTDIRTAIEHPRQAIVYLSSRIIPVQLRVLKQILKCAYQGVTRQLYLEAKVLELLALHLDQMLTPSNVKALAANDVDRIYQAREILIRDMVCPPSLNDLAQQVQLNERKLNEGFRQAFNTTVFGYLQTHRMHQARELLLEGGTSVQEAASYVGYASRSSFVAAFKKTFGITPSSCHQQQ